MTLKAHGQLRGCRCAAAFHGSTTRCANCHRPLIVRDWHLIRSYAVTEDGTCPHCSNKLAGHFGKFKTQFGRQRISILMSGR